MEASATLPRETVCRVCSTQIGTEFIVCPACETPIHCDCWYYNEGCATFGCCCAAPPEMKSFSRRVSGGEAPGLEVLDGVQSAEDRLGVHPVGKARPLEHLTVPLVWVPNTQLDQTPDRHVWLCGDSFTNVVFWVLRHMSLMFYGSFVAAVLFAVGASKALCILADPAPDTATMMIVFLVFGFCFAVVVSFLWILSMPELS